MRRSTTISSVVLLLLASFIAVDGHQQAETRNEPSDDSNNHVLSSIPERLGAVNDERHLGGRGEFGEEEGFLDTGSDAPSIVPSSAPSGVVRRPRRRLHSDTMNDVDSNMRDLVGRGGYEEEEGTGSDIPSGVPSSAPSGVVRRPRRARDEEQNDSTSFLRPRRLRKTTNERMLEDRLDESSDVPSSVPSDIPSSEPSDVPSKVPSSTPTDDEYGHLTTSDYPSIVPVIWTPAPSIAEWTGDGHLTTSDYPSLVPSPEPSTAPSVVELFETPLAETHATPSIAPTKRKKKEKDVVSDSVRTPSPTKKANDEQKEKKDKDVVADSVPTPSPTKKAKDEQKEQKDKDVVADSVPSPTPAKTPRPAKDSDVNGHLTTGDRVPDTPTKTPVKESVSHWKEPSDLDDDCPQHLPGYGARSLTYTWNTESSSIIPCPTPNSGNSVKRLHTEARQLTDRWNGHLTTSDYPSIVPSTSPSSEDWLKRLPTEGLQRKLRATSDIDTRGLTDRWNGQATTSDYPSIMPSLQPSSEDWVRRFPTESRTLTERTDQYSTITSDYPSIMPSFQPSSEDWVKRLPTEKMQLPVDPAIDIPSIAPSTSPTAKDWLKRLPTEEVEQNPTSRRLHDVHDDSDVPSMAPTSPSSSVPSDFPSLIPDTNTSEENFDVNWNVINATRQPSASPTFPPTIVTTDGPTATPSSRPTLTPSMAETSNLATNRPTTSPTVSASFQPTPTPSGTPTAKPPTANPTVPPSFFPTPSPTGIPTATPTFNPTEGPTSRVPTDAPSVKPSKRPSTSPTVAPSISPTVSPAPSTLPSLSSSPSTEPSPMPSTLPTASPSLLPSSAPSESKVPSASPTMKPSAAPSSSAAPSGRPSLRPSMTPSSSPTKTTVPSQVPSGKPSPLPSSSPSEKPSLRPSIRVTFVPSDSPSVGPSALPTSVPTSIPTELPTLLPSNLPTSRPSMVPSFPPSEGSFEADNIEATDMPTVLPTSDPLVEESTEPDSTLGLSGVTLKSSRTTFMDPNTVESFERVCEKEFLPAYMPLVHAAAYTDVKCQVVSQNAIVSGSRRTETQQGLIEVSTDAIVILLNVTSKVEPAADDFTSVVVTTIDTYSEEFQSLLSSYSDYFYEEDDGPSALVDPEYADGDETKNPFVIVGAVIGGLVAVVLGAFVFTKIQEMFDDSESQSSADGSSSMETQSQEDSMGVSPTSEPRSPLSTIAFEPSIASDNDVLGSPPSSFSSESFQYEGTAKDRKKWKEKDPLGLGRTVSSVQESLQRKERKQRISSFSTAGQSVESDLYSHRSVAEDSSSLQGLRYAGSSISSHPSQAMLGNGPRHAPRRPSYHPPKLSIVVSDPDSPRDDTISEVGIRQAAVDEFDSVDEYQLRDVRDRRKRRQQSLPYDSGAAVVKMRPPRSEVASTTDLYLEDLRKQRSEHIVASPARSSTVKQKPPASKMQTHIEQEKSFMEKLFGF